jgi:hypothetical protein
VVDGIRKIPEEPGELIRFGGVERRRAARAEFGGRSLQPGRVRTGEYDLGSFGACASRGFEADAGAPADHHDGLAGQVRSGRAV